MCPFSFQCCYIEKKNQKCPKVLYNKKHQYNKVFSKIKNNNDYPTITRQIYLQVFQNFTSLSRCQQINCLKYYPVEPCYAKISINNNKKILGILNRNAILIIFIATKNNIVNFNRVIHITYT